MSLRPSSCAVLARAVHKRVRCERLDVGAVIFLPVFFLKLVSEPWKLFWEFIAALDAKQLSFQARTHHAWEALLSSSRSCSVLSCRLLHRNGRKSPQPQCLVAELLHRNMGKISPPPPASVQVKPNCWYPKYDWLNLECGFCSFSWPALCSGV